MATEREESFVRRSEMGDMSGQVTRTSLLIDEHPLEDVGGVRGGFAKRVEECGSWLLASLVHWVAVLQKFDVIISARGDVTRRFSRMDGERYRETSGASDSE